MGDVTTHNVADYLILLFQELSKKEKEREKERQKKEEKEKKKKRRSSSSKEERIPRSPSGEAAIGPVPTSMKMKPNPSLGAMAQPRPHGEKTDGYHMCAQMYTCLPCLHGKVIVASYPGLCLM